MIEMGKKYRLASGMVVRRILCVDRAGSVNYPVIAEMENGSILSFGPNGEWGCNQGCLVEVRPYEDFKIDDPVMVKNKGERDWSARYFAGVATEGYAKAWVDGRTSWTANHSLASLCWDECRRPTEEELKGAALRGAA